MKKLLITALAFLSFGIQAAEEQTSTDSQTPQASASEQTTQAPTNEQKPATANNEQTQQSSTTEQTSTTSTNEQAPQASTIEQTSTTYTNKQAPQASTTEQTSITSTNEQAPQESTIEQTQAPKPVTKKELNCNYKIAANEQNIDQKLIINWAEKAALQAFTFAPDKIQTQMDDLKACFTDKGWTGFYDALEKSGNIKAIREQNLTVSSIVDGEPSISQVKDMRWKIIVPMEVVYQNTDNKITQTLKVDVLVGRKLSGDLGIMQVLATKKQATDDVTSDSISKPTANVDETPKTDVANTNPVN